jgi:hypothetical protein
MEAEMNDLAEVVMRPAMWWLTTNDYWNAFGIVWREEGAGQPYVELRGRDWDGIVKGAADLGMTLEMTEDEVKGGHGKEDYPSDPEGAWFYKTWRPVEFHWVKQTGEYRAHASAKSWDVLCDFLDEMGVEPPDRPAPTVKDGRVAA